MLALSHLTPLLGGCDCPSRAHLTDTHPPPTIPEHTFAVLREVFGAQHARELDEIVAGLAHPRSAQKLRARSVNRGKGRQGSRRSNAKKKRTDYDENPEK